MKTRNLATRFWLALGVAAVAFAEANLLTTVAGTEITRANAIARVRQIVNANAGPCRITHTQSVSAARVRAGWRVTARIRMSGVTENAIWIVSEAKGAAAQNQITSEIENGCP